MIIAIYICCPQDAVVVPPYRIVRSILEEFGVPISRNHVYILHIRLVPPNTHISQPCIYVTHKTCSTLQDSQISIRGMMQSPYLGDMTVEVESWNSALQQVEEITDLWYTCQKKVRTTCYLFVTLLESCGFMCNFMDKGM